MILISKMLAIDLRKKNLSQSLSFMLRKKGSRILHFLEADRRRFDKTN